MRIFKKNHESAEGYVCQLDTYKCTQVCAGVAVVRCREYCCAQAVVFDGVTIYEASSEVERASTGLLTLSNFVRSDDAGDSVLGTPPLCYIGSKGNANALV